MVNRIVVGAHYGLGSWLAQRMTAVLMVAYTAMLAVALMTLKPATYAAWRAFAHQGWFRVATLIFAVCLAWHAWVGMRDVLMDYVKVVGARLAGQTVVATTLAAYLGWIVQILWG